MHELALCQALLEQVEQLAAQHQAKAVAKIVLGIGALSGVDTHALQNAYPIASAGSLAQEAQLHIQRLPVRVRCQQCQQEAEAQPNKLICPYCGDWHTTLISGNEMVLLQVELLNF
jgi:hydrogenase nickel incorporation protein HypA/HybF